MNNTMIVTRDIRTVTRIAVIGAKTGSSIAAGAKAMMIESLKRQMRNGVAHFVYQKRNGEFREAWGTTSAALAAKHTNGNGECREQFATTAYFDVEAGSWRSFRWENLIAVY
ncbi:MAG: DUF2693 domain-containing protein [Bacteroidetes bacterium]|uniref:DUF2693 domain-containing protein n=1 Tax=Candidatus Cryptobacteroides merdavium TaxID=2840769 RepID=A0A9D9HC00_9BACT|nr:DUF2693 domain-containing protein [Candidatus Cryptobacteroides merdavium]